MNSVKIIAIPILGKSTNYKVSKLFARSPFFLIFDEMNQSVQYVTNEFMDKQAQSGKSIAKLLVARGVNVFCGYDIGFNVQKTAEENNIQLILLPDNNNMTAQAVINIIKNK